MIQMSEIEDGKVVRIISECLRKGQTATLRTTLRDFGTHICVWVDYHEQNSLYEGNWFSPKELEFVQVH